MTKNIIENNTIILDTCKSCGGTLTRSKDCASYICEFCNRTYHVLHDEHSSIKKIDNAELYFHSFNDPATARRFYLEASELNPADYRCWFGLAKTDTNNFSDFQITSSKLYEIENNYIFKALKTADGEISSAIQTLFKKYKNKVLNRIAEDKTNLSQKVETSDSQKSRLESQKKTLCTSLSEHKKQLSYLENENFELKTKRKGNSEYDKDLVLGFIISTIAIIILGKLLFFTDAKWDFSTLIVGIPFGIAAIAFIYTSLYILITTIKNFIIQSYNSNIQTRIDSNNTRIAKIKHEMQKEEAVISELTERLSKINDDLELKYNELKSL